MSYLTEAPVIRVWNFDDSAHVDYAFDTVKNRYYYTSGPIWLPVNARQSGDFLAADGSIHQELLGFRLHAVLAFDICADNQRPASIETPPRKGIDYEALREMMEALKAGWTVEFSPHSPPPGSSPSDTYRVIVEGLDVNRSDGQPVSHVQLTFTGTKAVSDMPTEF